MDKKNPWTRCGSIHGFRSTDIPDRTDYCACVSVSVLRSFKFTSVVATPSVPEAPLLVTVAAARREPPESVTIVLHAHHLDRRSLGSCPSSSKALPRCRPPSRTLRCK